MGIFVNVSFIVQFKIVISVIHKINKLLIIQIHSGKLTQSHLLVPVQLSEVTFCDDGAFFSVLEKANYPSIGRPRTFHVWLRSLNSSLLRFVKFSVMTTLPPLRCRLAENT